MERFGWSVMSVAREADSIGFSYSIGMFRTLHHPEIIIVGLPEQTAKVIINLVGKAVQNGRRFNDGDVSADFAEGYDVAFRAVTPAAYREYLGFAIRYYDGEWFPALQLVYPDRERRWPWDPAVSNAFRLSQPVLSSLVRGGQPSSAAAGAPADSQERDPQHR